MNFINPIEVLELTDTDITAIDGTTIKKAKKRVLADIELSDSGHYTYSNGEYTKSDIESVVDKLDDIENLEFYYFIANNADLNSFLQTGNIKFVQNFRQESIYKLPNFIQFISKHYSSSFDKFLIASYKEKDLDLFRKGLLLPELFTISDRAIAYRSLESFIKNSIDEIDVITKGLREDNTTETESSIPLIFTRILSLLNADKMKMLPVHFQPLKNQAASTIRNLSVQIYNHFSLSELAFNVISYALNLGIDGLTAQKLQDDYNTINDLNQQRLDREKYAPVIQKYAPIVTSLLDIKEKLGSKSLKPAQAVAQIDQTKLNDLNSTPEALIEIRDQIAIALRSISVDIWNDFNDIKSALVVIKLAVKINTSVDTKQNIIKAEQDLQALYNKHKHELICFFCETNSPVESALYKKTIYKETSRSYFPKKVQYSYKDVAVPRCSSCAEIHTKGSNTALMYTVGVGLFGAVLGYFADEHYIIGAIIGVIAGLILGGNQSEEAVKGKKIKTESAVSQYPPISGLIMQGWTFNKPSA